MVETTIQDNDNLNADECVSPGHLRGQYMRYIDEHRFFPEIMKEEAKKIISDHFSLIRQTLATIELTHRRTKE